MDNLHNHLFVGRIGNGGLEEFLESLLVFASFAMSHPGCIMGGGADSFFERRILSGLFVGFSRLLVLGGFILKICYRDVAGGLK